MPKMEKLFFLGLEVQYLELVVIQGEGWWGQDPLSPSAFFLPPHYDH